MIKRIQRRVIRSVGRPELLRWSAFWRMVSGARAPIAIKDANSILVIRPDEIGDVILTIPFIRALRHSAPDARISFLSKKGWSSVLENSPDLAEVETLPFTDGRNEPSYLFRLYRETSKLKARGFGMGGFDLVFLPRRATDWYGSVLVGHWLAGHGSVIVHEDKQIAAPEDACPLPPVPLTRLSNPSVGHEVDHTLWLLRACGAEVQTAPEICLWLSASEKRKAEIWVAGKFNRPGTFLVIHPSGGRSPLKQWPPEYFRELIKSLLAETDVNLLLIGGPDEPWIGEYFEPLAGDRVCVSVGELSLRELACVLSLSLAFVGGDSGPMHLAAAAGTEVVGIFGPTSERRFRPWGDKTRVVSLRAECSPDELGTYQDRCEHCIYETPRCMSELSVATVMETVQKLMVQTSEVLGHQNPCPDQKLPPFIPADAR